MYKLGRFTRREFVSVAASAAGGTLLPRAVLAAAGPRPAAGGAEPGHAESRDKGPARIRPFPLTQVRLGSGPCKEAMELDRHYLHSLSSDRLLHTFRVNAGLPTSAQPYGGWEKPDCELRGHFTGGHFLSACALMYASTGDTELKAKANELVAELAKCQKAIGNGYLSAFPEELFDRLRNGVAVWAPFYTLHKIMAGHLDMYVHCGNEQALEVAEGMARWVRHWSQSLSDEHMARVKLTEFGGMNEALYNLFAVTGKDEYLELGQRFDDERIFGPLAARRDELKGLHANTTIPKIVGAARGYELTGQQRYRDIAEFFWHTVTHNRAYCTGGTSSGEHWTCDPGKLAAEINNETEECCCAYNMLRLTRHLIGWTADPRPADYYERVLFNHRLGTQNPQDGMMMYFLPLVSGLWKFFNSPDNSFWCCTGTGVEEFAKLGDSIYFHDDRGLFVNLFIASQVHWLEKGLRLRQETNFPEQEGTTLIVETDQPVEMDLHVRIPNWATRGGTVKLNGAALPVFSSPSSYLTLSRLWKNRDQVEVSLPMSLHLSPLPGDETQQAMMYGPLVLAGRLGAEGLTKEMFYGGYNPVPKGESGEAPTMTVDAKDPLGWIEPVPNQPLTFRTVGQSRNLTLIPLYRLFGERYAVYWKVNQKSV
jgi:DUF1680 family protein